MIQLQSLYLLEIPFVSLSKHDLLTYITEKIQNSTPFTIFTPNPEILVKAWQDKNFAEILKKNEVNIPDGVGISLFTGIPAIKGRVLFREILSLAEKNNKKVFIVGGTEAVIKKTIRTMATDYPHLVVDGNSGPKYSTSADPLSEQDEKDHALCLDQIKEFKPDIIFVALGAPKQEFWINKTTQLFPQVSYMAIGGTLDTYTETKNVPPNFMEQNGLEWLHRLIQEPSRISRIINAIVVFPLLVIVDKAKRMN